MNFADRKDHGIAVRTGYELFSQLCAGVKTYERRIKPVVKTFQYVSKRSTETEILAYTETIKIKADRVIGDPANDYLFSLAEFTGSECKSEIFLFDRKEKGSSDNSFIGKRYPVSVAVTKISGDERGRTPFYSFEAEIYINGEGIIEERTVD